LYPEIKLKSKRADQVKNVILSHYSQDFKDLNSLTREIKERDQLRREQKHKNEEATRLLADLESTVYTAERDRNAIRQECEGLTRQIEELQAVKRAQQE
jgi:predicted  nucleic acid-binding Zn-ribbon protein